MAINISSIYNANVSHGYTPCGFFYWLKIVGNPKPKEVIPKKKKMIQTYITSWEKCNSKWDECEYHVKIMDDDIHFHMDTYSFIDFWNLYIWNKI